MKHTLLVLLVLKFSTGFMYEVCPPDNFCFPFNCCMCGAWDKCNIYIFIGDYLNMTCTLTSKKIDEGINSSQIYVSYGEGTNLTAEEIFVINSTSVGISRKIMDQKENEDTYRCRLESGIVSSSTILVEYPPRAVKSFACKIYNWDERMECSWDIGPYVNNKNIDVVLNMKDGSCPHLQKNNCTWETSDGIDFDMVLLNFSVKVTNTKTNDLKLTENLFIEQNANVMPNPVEFFEGETINGTCILLKWQHSKPDRNLYFTVFWNDSQAGTTKMELMVCKLKPATAYNFTIEARPGKDIGYPSEPVSNSTSTGYDKPSRPPEFRGSGYNVKEETCYDTNIRQLTVHWKKLPDEHHNGPMYGYYLETSTSQKRVIKTYLVNGSEIEQEIMDVPCDLEVMVTIKSWGIMGYSEEVSTIKIPRAKYLKPGAVVAIVICSIIFIILVIAFTVYVVRKKCCKKFKKVFEPPEIQMPEIDINFSKLISEETTSINGKDSGHGTAKSEEIGFPNGDARYSPVSDTASLHCYENTAMSEASETPFTREQSDEKLEADGKLEPENSRLSLNISMKSLPNDFEMNSCQSINSHTILMDKMEDDDDGYDFDAVKDCQSDEESQNEDPVESYVKKGESSSQSGDRQSSCQNTEDGDIRKNGNQSCINSLSPSTDESSEELTKLNQYKKYNSQKTEDTQDKITNNITTKDQHLIPQQMTNHKMSSA